MTMHRARALISLALLVLACSCVRRGLPSAEPIGVSTAQSASLPRDPLPSWKAGPTKQAIVDAITKVTSAGSPYLVPEEERVAAFDNDGTLWPERPMAEAAFTIARLKAEITENPVLAQQEPFRSILVGDVDQLSSLGPEGFVSALARTHAGMTDEAFELGVHSFLVDARHPVFGVPYPSLAYRPMRELLAYLREHAFTIYLSTAGDQGFARAFAPATYGIPRERIIGSTLGKELVVSRGRGDLLRRPELVSLNDRGEKAANLARYAGRRPIVAAGNVRSGGDVAMLTYARGRPGPSLALVVHHDDAAREFVYDEPDGATLAAAREHGFVVVSMKDDWEQIFDTPPPPRPAAAGP